MPDGWEVENGLDPKVWSAYNDEDSDGHTDLEEYEEGTDPLNPYQHPPDDDDSGGAGDMEAEDAGAPFIILICFVFIIGLIVFLMIVGFYSKIRKDRLLEHETRQRIMDFIKDNPGTYYSQIRKELDLAHGVVTHHINMLESQELVFSKQDRQFRRFYADGLYKDTPMVTGTQKKVLDEIRRYPGLSQKQISEHLDLYPMMVSYHVGQLETLGLVEKKKKGRRNLLYAHSKPKKDGDAEEGTFIRGPFEGPAPEMVIAEN
jgi:predicted transcriptional regulator